MEKISVLSKKLDPFFILLRISPELDFCTKHCQLRTMIKYTMQKDSFSNKNTHFCCNSFHVRLWLGLDSRAEIITTPTKAIF